MAMNVIDRDSLIGMVAGPLVWAVHFIVCYVVVAVACAFGFGIAGPGEWGSVRVALLVVSGVALAAIAAFSLLAWRRWLQAGGFQTPRDATQTRHQFMALGGLLLCILSGVAVIYLTMPLFFLPTCR